MCLTLKVRGKEGDAMGDEGDAVDAEYIENFCKEEAEKEYSGLEEHTQKEPTKPWIDGDSLRIVLDPEFPKIDRELQRRTKVQIYPENSPQQPLNIDIETLEYLLNVDLDMLLLYKYLTIEGSQQPAAGAIGIFNKEISIPLNGGSGAENILNLYGQTEHNEGTVRAIYGPKDSGLEQIMNELGEIERGLNEQDITVYKRTGGIVIDGVVLSPGEVRSVLDAAELYQLFEDGHSNAYDRKQQELPQPCADELRKNVLNPREGYKVTEVLKYPRNLFGVEAVRSPTEVESRPQMLDS